MGPSDFYVYEHWRPDLNVPFYVGKGRKRRAYVKDGRGKAYCGVVKTLAVLGLSVDVRFVHKGLTEKRAFDLEIEQIKKRRAQSVVLLNRTDGGNGTWGIKFTEERREKVRRSMLARVLPPETWERIKAGLSAANKGKVMSAESRQKMSISQTGRKHSEETKRKMRQNALAREAKNRELGLKQKRPIGFKHDAKAIVKIRTAALQRSARNRELGVRSGRAPSFVVSESTRQKLREAAVRRNAKKQLET